MADLSRQNVERQFEMMRMLLGAQKREYYNIHG